MEASDSPSPRTDERIPAFSDVLCGVDGSRPSRDAVRQAAALAAPGGSLLLVAVTWTVGVGPTEMSELTAERAQAALEDAWQEAVQAGASATWKLVRAEHAPEALIQEARGHDLLALGSHGHSRAAGILFGSTASTAAHRAGGPVLIARRPPGDGDFPSKVLLASDGSSASDETADLAARIAAAHGSEVTIVHVADGAGPDSRRTLAEQSVRLVEATGSEPTVVEASGDAHREIAGLAGHLGSSLIVIGSRGLSGIKALGSVSERVAHEAVCSVLIARPPAGPQRA